MTAYNLNGEPLHIGTDYEVYCYAEDDLCLGCKAVTGTSVSAVHSTQTAVRTKDYTPPKLQIIDRRSVSREQIHITLQVDEGARVWCAAWTSQPASFSSTYSTQIKNYASQCSDAEGRRCGTFWVYDLDDL